VFVYRLDGYYNVPAIPVGVLGFLLFVPVFWLLPRRWIRAGIITTSIAFAVLTWPTEWCVTFGLAVLYGYGVVAICQHRVRSGGANRPAGRRWVLFVWGAVHLAYIPALIWPKFPWLPYEPVLKDRPYYWVAWLGLMFLVARVVHVAVDVCHAKIPRVRFVDYLTYVLFAPTLRIGPIMRFGELMPQLETWRDRLTPRDVGLGLARVFRGLIELGVMLFIMKNLMEHAFWGTPERFSPWVVLRTAAAAPFFMYMWMAGYASIAIGLGRMMGFVVPENFGRPWLATSIREFWKRWHITMGSWLFDYIYIPLGGNRRHVFVNYLVTFLYCALWHGLIGSFYVWALSQIVGLYVNRRWHLYWSGQREAETRLYDALRRRGLVGGWFSRVLAWGLTTAYQILTIAIVMDESYAGVRWIGYLLGLYPG